MPPPESFGPFILEFKRRVWGMTDREFYQAHNQTFQQIGLFDWTLTNLDYFKDWVRGNLLEIGCASGRTLHALKTLLYPYLRPDSLHSAVADFTVGVDISRYALQAGKRNPRGVEVIWADAEKSLPFPDRTFDTVLCGHTLEHLRRPERAIGEMRRVCRDRIIILIPLQGEEHRWKMTNTHIQFWPTVESFEEFYGMKADEALIVREGTLAVMLFRQQ